MDYIYDIVLNFQNDYYDFYEWKQSNKIINVKKIIIFIQVFFQKKILFHHHILICKIQNI